MMMMWNFPALATTQERFLGAQERRFDDGTAIQPFPVGSNSRWRPAAILENFKRPYLSNVLSDSLYADHTLPSVS